jgi:hypothetical protein
MIPPWLESLGKLPAYADLRAAVISGRPSPRFARLEDWAPLVLELEAIREGELDDPEELEELEYFATELASDLEELFGQEAPAAPYYALPAYDLDEARAILANRAAGFYRDVIAWLEADPSTRGAPPHRGMKATVGAGKSFALRHPDHLGAAIAALKAKGLPARFPLAVKQHKLADQSAADMQADGINAAVFRGRAAPDPDAPGRTMCLDLEAVTVALEMGESVGKTVCGTANGLQCPYFAACGYQRQMATVAAADVPIFTHEGMIGATTPDAVKHDAAAVLIDEDFWQATVKDPRTLTTAELREAPGQFPVLRHTGREDLDDTDELITIWSKIGRARERMADGFALRPALIAAGVTADDCARAVKLEWRRWRDGLLRPGMTPAQRQDAKRAARGNRWIATRAELAKELARLLRGNDDATGAVEAVHTDKGELAFTLRTCKPLAGWAQSVPLMHTSATMAPVLTGAIEGFRVVADLRVKAPHEKTVVIDAGFGKSGLANAPRESQAENIARDHKRTELRNFVASISAGAPTHVAVHQAIEELFTDIPAVETTHLNDAHGLNSLEHVAFEFIIGPSRPRPSELRDIAIALTSRPIAAGQRTNVRKRAWSMADGSAHEVTTPLYDDPTMQEVADAIIGASIDQARRGRGVNRTADNPLVTVIMANEVRPGAIDLVMSWREARPNVRDKMLARGAEIDAPAYAARVYPDLFVDKKGNQGSHEAARNALSRRREGGFSAVNAIRSLIGNAASNTLVEVEFRPIGRGQGMSLARLPASRAVHDFQADMEGIFGTSVVVELVDAAPMSPVQPYQAGSFLAGWDVATLPEPAFQSRSMPRAPPDG